MTSVACADVAVDLDHTRIVDGVSLRVEPGEWVSIVGPNGAGKSTLLRAIAGLVPIGGEVELDGHPAGRLRRRDRARLLALVPQAPVVPPGMTVADYVLLGRTPHVPLFGAETLHDVLVAERTMAQLELLPFAARALSSLSGGERQRVFLARALAQEATVLLLDEPTTGLDVGYQQQVLELIDRLRRDHRLTVLSTMHDLTLAGQYADRLVLLDGGRVVSSGPAADVLTEEHIARSYGAHVRVVHHAGQPVVMPVRAASEPSG